MFCFVKWKRQTRLNKNHGYIFGVSFHKCNSCLQLNLGKEQSKPACSLLHVFLFLGFNFALSASYCHFTSICCFHFSLSLYPFFLCHSNCIHFSLSVSACIHLSSLFLSLSAPIFLCLSLPAPISLFLSAGWTGTVWIQSLPTHDRRCGNRTPHTLGSLVQRLNR